jgi:hypothetical protein
MPLRVSWHLGIQVLTIWITEERRMKPPGPDLYWGDICPCLVL